MNYNNIIFEIYDDIVDYIKLDYIQGLKNSSPYVYIQ